LLKILIKISSKNPSLILITQNVHEIVRKFKVHNWVLSRPPPFFMIVQKLLLQGANLNGSIEQTCNNGLLYLSFRLGPRAKTGAPKVEKQEGRIFISILPEGRNKRAKNDNT
jgi:hypothetical protein